MRVAAAHPRKHGDAIYTLPTLRALAERHQTPIDFYTSVYCEPLRSLFEAQDCVGEFVVSESYVLERMDMGCQPAFVPVSDEYDTVYQLGYRAVPDCPLPEYIGREAGIRVGRVFYRVPDLSDGFPLRDYYVLAPRGDSGYREVFQEFIRHSPLSVVIVGGPRDGDVFDGENVYHATGESYLTTASLIKWSRGFVGLMSSQLTLANGFEIPKVVPHDGHSWDLRHLIYSPYNHYPVNPTAQEILSLIRS